MEPELEPASAKAIAQTDTWKSDRFLLKLYASDFPEPGREPELPETLAAVAAHFPEYGLAHEIALAARERAEVPGVDLLDDLERDARGRGSEPGGWLRLLDLASRAGDLRRIDAALAVLEPLAPDAPLVILGRAERLAQPDVRPIEGDPNSPRALYDRLAGASDIAGSIWIRVARLASRVLDVETAMRCLSRVSDARKGPADHKLQILALFALGADREAAARISRLLRTYPDDPDLLLLDTDVSRRLGFRFRREGSWVRLLSLPPDTPALVGRSALAMTYLERYREARARLSETGASSPEIVLARALLDLVTGNAEAAAKTLAAGEESHPWKVGTELLVVCRTLQSSAWDRLQVAFPGKTEGAGAARALAAVNEILAIRNRLHAE